MHPWLDRTRCMFLASSCSCCRFFVAPWRCRVVSAISVFCYRPDGILTALHCLLVGRDDSRGRVPPASSQKVFPFWCPASDPGGEGEGRGAGKMGREGRGARETGRRERGGEEEGSGRGGSVGSFRVRFALFGFLQVRFRSAVCFVQEAWAEGHRGLSVRHEVSCPPLGTCSGCWRVPTVSGANAGGAFPGVRPSQAVSPPAASLASRATPRPVHGSASQLGGAEATALVPVRSALGSCVCKVPRGSATELSIQDFLCLAGGGSSFLCFSAWGLSPLELP